MTHARPLARAFASALLALLLPGAPAAGPAEPDPTPLAEELLDALHRDGVLDDERYRELREKAERERADAAKGGDGDAGPGWSIRWDDGTRLERDDGRYRIKLAGRILNDWAAIEQSPGIRERVDGGRGLGTELRRARLALSGRFEDRLVFKAQYEFAGGDADFKDVYMGLLFDRGDTWVHVGHQKQHFSLQGMASSNDITFMERGLPEVFLGAERDTGLAMLTGLAEGRATLAVGGFRIADEFGNGFAERFGDAEAWALTGRATWLPFWRDDGSRLLHVGAGYSHQFRGDPPAPQVSFAIPAESHLGADLADTGTIANAENVDLGNLELAAVMGRLHLESELTGVRVQRNRSDPELLLWGAYAQAGVFLTGESRPYDRGDAVFGRLKPLRPFDPARGDWGAFELAARFSYLDLHDADVSGGVLSDTTLGLNWYLFSNARIMLNYVHAVLHGVGRSDAGQIRFQVTF